MHREADHRTDGPMHREADHRTDGSRGRATFLAADHWKDGSRHHARAHAAARSDDRCGWTRNASSGARSPHRHAPACLRGLEAAAEFCRRCDPSRAPGGAPVSQSHAWDAVGATRTCSRRDPGVRGAACPSRGVRDLPCLAVRFRDAERHSWDVRDRTPRAERRHGAEHPHGAALHSQDAGCPIAHAAYCRAAPSPAPHALHAGAARAARGAGRDRLRRDSGC